MPRQKDKVHSYFKPGKGPKGEDQSLCLVYKNDLGGYENDGQPENNPDNTDTTTCGIIVKGKHAGNLKRHIKGDHPNFYKIHDLDSNEKTDNESNQSCSIVDKKRKHITDYFPVKENAKKIKFEVCFSKDELDCHVIELISKNGVAVDIFNKSALKKVYERLYQGVTKQKTVVNSDVARKLVISKAEEYKNHIKQSVLGKLLFVQLDCCTRLRRSFLGVNIQFVGLNLHDHYETYVVTLGVIEVVKQHTAANLRKEIIKVLQNFGIELKQVLSITTDNGANVLKSTKLLDEDLKRSEMDILREIVPVPGPSGQDSVPVPDEEEDPEINHILENDEEDDETNSESGGSEESSATAAGTGTSVESSGTSKNVESSAAGKNASDELYSCSSRIVQSLLGSWSANDKDKDKTMIQSIRCAAHTLQLAVNDGLKHSLIIAPVSNTNPDDLNAEDEPGEYESSSVNAIIEKVRKIVKKFRTTTFLIKLCSEGVNKFILDNSTRWGSQYDMLKRFVENKNFVNDNEDFDNWDQVEKILEALAPCRKATIQLQFEKLSLDSFFKIWTLCKMHTKKLTDNDLAQKIAQCMEEREKQLFQNNIIAAFFFTHPVYKSLFKNSSSRRDELIKFLMQLMNRLKAVEGRGDDNEHSNATTNDIAAVVADPVSDPFDEIQDLIEGVTSPNAETTGCIENELNLFWATDFKVILKEYSSNEFWNSTRQKRFPSVYKLHILLNAVPSTQVAVERMFSHLRYILSDLRGVMAEDLLAAILLLRCNKIFG